MHKRISTGSVKTREDERVSCIHEDARGVIPTSFRPIANLRNVGYQGTDNEIYGSSPVYSFSTPSIVTRHYFRSAPQILGAM